MGRTGWTVYDGRKVYDIPRITGQLRIENIVDRLEAMVEQHLPLAIVYGRVKLKFKLDMTWNTQPLCLYETEYVGWGGGEKGDSLFILFLK